MVLILRSVWAQGFHNQRNPQTRTECKGTELLEKQVSSSNDSFVKILPYSCRCKTGVPVLQSGVHDWGSWPPRSTLRPPVLRTSHAWGSCLILGVQAHVAHDHVRRVSRLGAIVRTQHNRDDGRPAVMCSIHTGYNRGNC